MRVRYSRTALDELEEIVSYVAARNSSAAAAVASRVEQVVGWVGEFPRIGYVIESDVRMLPIGRYPFLVFYNVAGDKVVIRNIRHMARSARTSGT